MNTHVSLFATVDSAIEDLTEAFQAEVQTYRETEDMKECEAASSRASSAALAFIERFARNPHPDAIPALALIQRRWLATEGAYGSPSETAECALVDAVLRNHRFNHVPVMWSPDTEQFAPASHLMRAA